jgi:hypothetical protein
MKKEIYLNLYKETYDTGMGYTETQSHWTFLGLSDRSQFSATIENYKENEKIYVIYSTGDSFGMDHNNRCEIIGATHDQLLAYKVEEFIKKDNYNKDEKYILHNIDVKVEELQAIND